MAKSFSYDHPAYRVPQVSNHACAAGANAVSANRFTAFTNLIVKAAQVTVKTAGTSASAGNGVIIKKIVTSGSTTTAITTIALNTQTAGVSTNVSLSDTELAAGEQLTFTNGTDATGAHDVAVEFVVKPGADVT